MILLGCIGEDMDDARRAGFCVCECAYLSLCVDSYNDVDVYDGHGEVFFVVCLVAFIPYQSKSWLFCIH